MATKSLARPFRRASASASCPGSTPTATRRSSTCPRTGRHTASTYGYSRFLSCARTAASRLSCSTSSKGSGGSCIPPRGRTGPFSDPEVEVHPYLAGGLDAQTDSPITRFNLLVGSCRWPARHDGYQAVPLPRLSAPERPKSAPLPARERRSPCRREAHRCTPASRNRRAVPPASAFAVESRSQTSPPGRTSMVDEGSRAVVE